MLGRARLVDDVDIADAPLERMAGDDDGRDPGVQRSEDRRGARGAGERVVGVEHDDVGVRAAQVDERFLRMFLVVAPLGPLAGVAVAFAGGLDPTREIGLAAPYSGLRLLLIRTAAVLFRWGRPPRRSRSG